jgi:DnaJ-class molecular chaperone
MHHSHASKRCNTLLFRFGDLRIMLNIKFPTSLSPEEKQLLRSVLDEGEIAKLEATIERKALLSGFQDYLQPVGNAPVFHKSEDITSNAYVLLVDAALSAPGRVVEWTFAAVRECELAFQVRQE